MRERCHVVCPRLRFKNGDAGDRLQREDPRTIRSSLGSLMRQEHDIPQYLGQVFDSLPSPFAQLAFLASLRDPYTGHYVHEGWATVCSPAQLNVTLRDAHQNVFASVADLSLVDVSRELRRHFKSISEGERRVATLWLDTKPYYEMIPEGCSSLSRKYFISQVHVALELLIHAPSWEYLDEPTSSLNHLPPHFGLTL
jgi:hypothetical protein